LCRVYSRKRHNVEIRQKATLIEGKGLKVLRFQRGDPAAPGSPRASASEQLGTRADRRSRLRWPESANRLWRCERGLRWGRYGVTGRNGGGEGPVERKTVLGAAFGAKEASGTGLERCTAGSGGGACGRRHVRVRTFRARRLLPGALRLAWL